jgi:hypothetical protein
MGLTHSTFYGYDNVFPLRDPEWEDKSVTITHMKLPPIYIPEMTEFKGGVVYAFRNIAQQINEDRLFFLVKLPHGYKEGSEIALHAHWVGEDTSAGNVCWKFSHSWANEADVTGFPTPSVLNVTASNNTVVAAQLNNATTAHIDGTGKKMASQIIGSLRRNSSNSADTYSGKAYLTDLTVCYQYDQIGSQNHATKP